MTSPSNRPSLRIGLLGAAAISERSIVGSAARGGHRLVVVAARDVERARGFAAQYGVERVVETYDDVINDPEVDLVYNPLANSLHAQWNLKALEAGKHVLSEKPFAANGAEARRVAEVARTSGRVVMEAYHYAFHPVMQRVLEVVSSGEIGSLRHVDSAMIIPAPEDANPRWSFDLAGGALMDLGCYSLHAMRLLGASAGGAPRIVSAHGKERPGHRGVDEWLTAEVSFPGGATGRAFANMDGPDVVMSLRVIGSTGQVVAHNFVLPHTDDRVEITTATTTTTTVTRVERLGTRPSYDFQLDVIAAAIAQAGAAVGTGVPPPLDVDDAVATMDLIDATYEAAGFTPRPSSP